MADLVRGEPDAAADRLQGTAEEEAGDPFAHRTRVVAAQPSDQCETTALRWLLCRVLITEAVGLDVDDVRLSARKGVLRILGKGEKVREVYRGVRQVRWAADPGEIPRLG